MSTLKLPVKCNIKTKHQLTLNVGKVKSIWVHLRQVRIVGIMAGF